MQTDNEQTKFMKTENSIIADIDGSRSGAVYTVLCDMQGAAFRGRKFRIFLKKAIIDVKYNF